MLRQVIYRLSEINSPRGAKYRLVFRWQAFQQPFGGHIFGGDPTGCRAEPDARQRKHNVAFVAMPVIRFVPLTQGIGERGDEVTARDAVIQEFKGGAEQMSMMLPGFGKQDRHIRIQGGGGDNSHQQLFTQPFAKL